MFYKQHIIRRCVFKHLSAQEDEEWTFIIFRRFHEDEILGRATSVSGAIEKIDRMTGGQAVDIEALLSKRDKEINAELSNIHDEIGKLRRILECA